MDLGIPQPTAPTSDFERTTSKNDCAERQRSSQNRTPVERVVKSGAGDVRTSSCKPAINHLLTHEDLEVIGAADGETVHDSTDVDSGSGGIRQLRGKIVKKVKELVAGGPNATGLAVNNPANVTIREVNVTAKTKNTTIVSEENMKCTQMHVMQPNQPTGEFVNGLQLYWTIPRPKLYTIIGIKVSIRDKCGEVFNKKFHKLAECTTVPNKKLCSGTKYYASVTCEFKGEDGKKDTEKSDVMEFTTSPGPPRDLNLACDAENAYVSWSPCTGVDRFTVLLFDDELNILDSSEANGTQFRCTFKIDSNRQILTGRFYNIEVVAIQGQWRISSGKKSYFLGTSDMPKNVKANLVKGTNKVKLTWQPPPSSGWSTKYIVEVICEGSERRKMRKIKSTSMDIPGLKGGMSYYFRIATVNGDATSFWSNSKTIKTEACAIKVEKFCLEANQSDCACSLDCTWDPADESTGYKIKYRCSHATISVKVGENESRFTISNLVPNTEYHVSMKAEDGRGFGPYTDEITKKMGFDKPKDVHLEVTDGDEITVTFTPALEATNHKVVMSDSDGKEYSRVLNTGILMKVFSGLSYNKLHRATVTALYADMVGGTVQSEEKLTVPQAPGIKAIRWKPLADNPETAFLVTTEVEENCTEYQAQIICLDRDDYETIINMNTDEEKKTVSLLYKCCYEGLTYGVALRSRNSAGYSEWSKKQIIKTAPARVASLTVELDEEKLLIEWRTVKYAKSYVLIFFESGKEIDRKKVKGPPYTFPVELDHGLVYFCEIYPHNATGDGSKTRSNSVLIPLDRPSNLILEDRTDRVKFSWTPSTGMTSAQVLLCDSALRQVKHIIYKDEWMLPPVAHGEQYEIKVWGRNGKNVLSKKFLHDIYVTAPSAVFVKRNAMKPETCLDVEVQTSYPGPLSLKWKWTKGETSQKITERIFTIEDLEPATEYSVCAECIYKEDKRTACCHARPVMTLPGQVTGLQCKNTDGGRDELRWNGCGNDSVLYEITWSRNNISFQPITTKETFWEFEDLEAGSYVFRVSAGGGNKSSACFVVVPDTPNVHVDVLSCDCIRIVFPPLKVVEKYGFVLKNKQKRKKSFEITENECIIEKDDFDFVKGEKHSIISKAYWKGHSSTEIKNEFFTGLENPTDLTCKLDHYGAQRPVTFTWNNSRGMFNAKIQIREMDNSLIVEESTSKSSWEYWGLKPNRTYELFLWPGDGRSIFYDDSLRHVFTTAPGPPRSVRRKRNKSDPTRKFDIEIDSDYSGQFLTKVEDLNGKLVAKHSGNEKSFTIEGLSPGTQYFISAQCVFEDYVSKKIYVMD